MSYRKFALLLVLLGANPPAAGADTSHYKVEVVVFESLDRRALRSELWPQDPGAPSLAGALEFEGTGPYLAPDVRCPEQGGDCGPLGQPLAGTRPAGELNFHLLPASEYQLEGVVNRLQASRQYRPLAHLAWQQPALSQKHALAVRIAGGWPQTALSSPHRSGSAVHYVDGTFRLYRRRYLHVLADLVLYRFEPLAFSSQAQRPAFPGEEQTAAPAQPVARFRLSEHRRMRSKELHYLDHPVFGLLVQITPYRVATSSEPAQEDDEPEDDGLGPAEEGENEPVDGDGG